MDRQSLWPESASIDPIGGASANTDNLAAGDSDVERAPVRTEDTGRLNPALRVPPNVLIDPHGPRLRPGMGLSVAPWVGDPLLHADRPPVVLCGNAAHGLTWQARRTLRRSGPLQGGPAVSPHILVGLAAGARKVERRRSQGKATPPLSVSVRRGPPTHTAPGGRAEVVACWGSCETLML